MECAAPAEAQAPGGGGGACHCATGGTVTPARCGTFATHGAPGEEDHAAPRGPGVRGSAASVYFPGGDVPDRGEAGGLAGNACGATESEVRDKAAWCWGKAPPTVASVPLPPLLPQARPCAAPPASAPSLVA